MTMQFNYIKLWLKKICQSRKIKEDKVSAAIGWKFKTQNSRLFSRISTGSEDFANVWGFFGNIGYNHLPSGALFKLSNDTSQLSALEWKHQNSGINFLGNLKYLFLSFFQNSTV